MSCLLLGLRLCQLECAILFFFLMIRRPPRSTLDRSSAASDVYKRQAEGVHVHFNKGSEVATESPAESPLVDSLHKVAQGFYPDSQLVPMRMVGSTDARHFRRIFDTAAYGFGMWSQRLGMDDIASMAHGDNERIDIESPEHTHAL